MLNSPDRADISRKFPLTLQERVLGHGMLYGKTNAATDFIVGPDGQRINSNTIKGDKFDALAQMFRTDPFTRLQYARENLRGIMQDEKLSPEVREDRVKQYVDAYFDLQVKLDRIAFPADNRLHEGIPEYIPDGLSDMGSDPNIDPDSRSREKIRVDKSKIFKKAKPLFYEIFSMKFNPQVSLESWKKYVAKRIADYVYISMPYNFQQKTHNAANMRSIGLDEIAEQKLAVCRHHALVTQVLNQTFGITSRLMKSDLIFGEESAGPHANNLVRIQGKWYLLDTTNPEKKPYNTTVIFFKPIPERDIDLNQQNYQWKFDEANGTKRTYRSRSNMYYRIKDNRTDPIR